MNQQSEYKRVENTQSEKKKGPPGQHQAYQHPHDRGTKRREWARVWKPTEEIMTGNFPNQAKEIDIWVQEAQRVPDKMNPKRPVSRQHN